MTALTADKRTQYTEGVDVPAPVDGGSKIFAGANACFNTAGFLVPGGDTSGLIYAGVSRSSIDNSLGQDGDELAVIRRRGLFLMEFATEISQANVGDNVFLVDDQLVDLAGNVTYDIFCGIIAQFVDTTHAFVDILPAILQADVASHIADPSGAHAASAISAADAGNHFPAAEATVEAQLQKLGKGPFFLTLPRFTGWTKDAADHAIALPAIESPNPVMVKRAYVNLGTAPGADKTLTLKLNDTELLSIAGADTQGEAEALSIAVAKDTDFIIKANETASGAGANCDITLVMYIDDGE
ncbi:MAG: hypothetical protein GXX82_06120 [Syntrophorhabdus sp.]|nr:hypothetical protein [Syntrophorhabdus sp.]